MTDAPIFVFGSNLAGRHGKGAALHARKFYGAKYGEGVGFQGQSYAIPTKDEKLKTLPLEIINYYVKQFSYFVLYSPERSFKITRIGCGLAGYKDEQIAPMFHRLKFCDNVEFPEEWKPYLGI